MRKSEAVGRISSCAAQHFDVVMYGDTLVEAWRGTILGEPSLRVQGCSEIFHSHFGHKYSTAVYGIAGEPASPAGPAASGHSWYRQESHQCSTISG